MTDMNRPDSSNLDAVRADGVAIAAVRTGALTAYGCTLASGQTYYFPFGAGRSPVPAETPLNTVQVRWDAAAILTITIESCIWPATTGGQDHRGPAHVTDFHDETTTPGFWLQQNPTTAYVPAKNGTPTSMTVAVAGGTAGGCEFDLGNFGARRGRVKIVVGGTGGVVRVGVHGKAAA